MLPMVAVLMYGLGEKAANRRRALLMTRIVFCKLLVFSVLRIMRRAVAI